MATFRSPLDIAPRAPLRFAGLVLAMTLVVPAGAGRAEDAAGGAAAPARKVLVVAKVREEAKRRQLEEEGRIELQKRGVETLLGSDVMVESDFASEETIRMKVDSLGVDGVLAFVPLAVDESVKTSSVSIGVGIGVGGGGGLGVMVGGSVPLGSSSKVVRKVRVRARYFARPFAGPAWEKVYYESLTDDTTRLSQHLAYDSVKALKKKKLIPAK
jgi:hypothetical protein